MIDSLTEEEFISLQKSIMASFDAVEELMDAVKDGMKNLKFYNQTLYDLNDTYFNSTESSVYYKDKYLELFGFLSANSHTFDKAAEENDFKSLLLAFQETFEEPFNLMKSSILQVLFTREELKSRINQNTDFQEVKRIEESNRVCEEIRNILLNHTVGSVRKEIEKAPASLIETALVQHISILGDCLIESKDEGRDSITSILAKLKGKNDTINTLRTQFQEFINQFSWEQFLWNSLSSHDDALDNLLTELKKKPSDDFFDLDIHFLQQLKRSSDWERRKFYSGKRFQYSSMRVPDSYFKQNIKEFKSGIEGHSIKYYNQLKNEIYQEAVCSINEVFQDMLHHNPAGNQNVKLYRNPADVDKKSVDEVMKDINDRYKYEVLKAIFCTFFLRLLSGKNLDKVEKFVFVKEEDSVDPDVQKIMDSVAEVVWNEKEKGHLVINPDQNLLNLYHDIENMRSVQEDQVVDAIIRGPVYQKKNNS